MARVPSFGSRSGVTIMQVLIVSVMMAGLGYAMSQMISGLGKSQKSLDLKAQSQEFGTRLRYSLASPDRCKEALGLGTGGLDAALKVGLNGLRINGKDYSKAPPTVEGDLRYTAFDLDITGYSAAAGVKDYLGALTVVAEPVRPQQSSLPAYTSSYAIRLKVKDNKIISCFVEGAGDARAMCMDMGGRWFTDATGGPYYGDVGGRCVLGADIMLAKNELPYIEYRCSTDPSGYCGYTAPKNGEVTATGERLEQCLYQKAGQNVMNAYRCPATWANTKGNRCIFNDDDKQWQVWPHDADGNRTGSKPKYRCDQVRISMEAPESVVLDWNVPLFGVTGAAYADGVCNNDRSAQLGTVTRCRTNPTKDIYKDCKNPDDPEAAMNLQAGTCVYLGNPAANGIGKTSVTLSSAGVKAVQKYNDSLEPGVAQAAQPEYSGWAIMTANYNSKKPGALKVLPCWDVEVNTAACDPGVTGTAGATAVSTPPANNAALGNVRYCSQAGGKKVTCKNFEDEGLESTDPDNFESGYCAFFKSDVKLAKVNGASNVFIGGSGAWVMLSGKIANENSYGWDDDAAKTVIKCGGTGAAGTCKPIKGTKCEGGVFLE